MAFHPQEIAALFSGSVQNYLFNFAFESRNPGYEFDMDAWVNDLNKFSSNDLTIMSPEKEREMQAVLDNLDKYKKKKNSIDLI